MSAFHSLWNKMEISKLLEKQGARIHFIGVGGVGVGGLFLLADSFGYRVSGSDRSKGELVGKLIERGHQINIGHHPETVIGKDLVVYSLAISEDDEELARARTLGIPSISRAEFLGALMLRYGERIGVSGAHGKSTTTAMIDAIFTEANRAHTALVGATLDNGLPIRIKGRDCIVYEACEYKDSFLHFSPTAAVFTSLELDHVDYFKDLDAIKASYLAAMNTSGIVVINGDDRDLLDVARSSQAQVITFGKSELYDYKIATKLDTGGCYRLSISQKGREILNVLLRAPGEFNAKNAAAAIVLSLEVGILPDVCVAAISRFISVGRRLEEICTHRGMRVYYDYAHHPTEIRAVIRAMHEMGYPKVGVIFKPHTYSRTAAFIDEFASALSGADRCVILEIDGIRESNATGIASTDLSSMIDGAVCLPDSSVAPSLFFGCDAVILMGAADLSIVKSAFTKSREITEN